MGKAGNSPMHIIGIDPGVTTGFAWFVSGVLSRAFAQSFDDFIAEPPCVEYEPMDVVVEFPKWRPYSHEEIDDLLGLARKAGRIEQHYRMCGAHVEVVFPHVWKGSVPKGIHGQRILSKLTPEELALLPTRPRSKKHPHDHNMIDGVGIALWKLGRLR